MTAGLAPLRATPSLPLPLVNPVVLQRALAARPRELPPPRRTARWPTRVLRHRRRGHRREPLPAFRAPFSLGPCARHGKRQRRLPPQRRLRVDHDLAEGTRRRRGARGSLRCRRVDHAVAGAKARSATGKFGSSRRTASLCNSSALLFGYGSMKTTRCTPAATMCFAQLWHGKVVE